MPATRTLWLILLALLALPASAGAADYRSINAGQVNIRTGPGTDHPRKWVVSQGYPVRVLEHRDNWLRVVDHEGDKGWVAAKLVSGRRMVIVTKSLVNVRRGPGTDNPVVFQAEGDVLLEYMDARSGWVKVRHNQGATGWVHQALVWGD